MKEIIILCILLPTWTLFTGLSLSSFEKGIKLKEIGFGLIALFLGYFSRVRFEEFLVARHGDISYTYVGILGVIVLIYGIIVLLTKNIQKDRKLSYSNFRHSFIDISVMNKSAIMMGGLWSIMWFFHALRSIIGW